jgi:hypothetical protein
MSSLTLQLPHQVWTGTKNITLSCKQSISSTCTSLGHTVQQNYASCKCNLVTVLGYQLESSFQWNVRHLPSHKACWSSTPEAEVLFQVAVPLGIYLFSKESISTDVANKLWVHTCNSHIHLSRTMLPASHHTKTIHKTWTTMITTSHQDQSMLHPSAWKKHVQDC